MEKILVVALSGRMRSGKSFVANHLVEHHRFQRLSFAQPLKDDIASMGFPQWAIEKKPDWMRLLMQAYGQARRALDPDYWVKQLMAEITNMEHTTELFNDPDQVRVVIDDMRFQNEALALREWETQTRGVRLLRLYRIGDPGEVAHLNDQSEHDLDHYDNWDAIVQAGSGDTDTLVKSVMEALRLPKEG